MNSNCRDIRNTADFVQGKISEFEVLLLAYADQKAYLTAEIERIKAELIAENTEESFQNL